MSQDLRQPLRDLGDDLPDRLDTAGLACTAWATGRRRRLRRRLLSAGAVGAVLVVLAVGVTSLVSDNPVPQPAGSHAGPRVDGYPERILHPWWLTDLPATPGPVAGMLRQSDGWDVVSATGHLWRLPAPIGPADEFPALSPNGRHLGYLTGKKGRFVIHDLVTGRITVYRSVGSGWAPGPAIRPHPPRYMMSGQAPALWSPNGTHMLLWGDLTSVGTKSGPADDHRQHMLLLDLDGHARLVAGPTRPATPAGWASPDRLVWVGDPGPRTPNGRRTRIGVTDLTGHRVRSFAVHLPNPIRAIDQTQWSWTVSPDGRQLLLTVTAEFTDEPSAGYRYSMADGATIGKRQLVPGIYQPCSSGWAATTPVVPVLNHGARTVTASQHPRTLSVADRGLHSECLLWAGDALAGSAHGKGFGDITEPWTWWWWPEALVTLAGLAVTVWFERTRRRRPARNQDALTQKYRDTP